MLLTSPVWNSVSCYAIFSNPLTFHLLHINVQIRIEGFMPFLLYMALCKNLTTLAWDNFGVGLSTQIISAFELPKLSVFKYIFAEDDNDAIRFPETIKAPQSTSSKPEEIHHSGLQKLYFKAYREPKR
ncbi:hypothetical protein M422DRAFT_265176 [Sphaerobolus stellatus SS14]|uniref:Uncharacterized protein n=1 Tax=Sphaerobolus stellatus (strain SS14) TaxID=990650 RepID=A0A0C9TS09_SPHS4|nr:hypothetical protein M422DRAFT_265176 [Sphaerobolus stellatus SS14]